MEGQSTVCWDGILGGRAVYCLLQWYTVWYGGVLCGRAVNSVLWQCSKGVLSVI